MHNKMHRESESQTPHKSGKSNCDCDPPIFESKTSYADEILKKELNRLKAQQIEREYMSSYIDQ